MTELIHEGTKTFAGKGPGLILAEIYVAVALGVAPIMIKGDASLLAAVAMLLGSAALFIAWYLYLSRQRVQVTSTEVRVLRWGGQRVVSRGQIAEVVHIVDLDAWPNGRGYIALLDANGMPLWRSATSTWSPATLEALGDAGRTRLLVDAMTYLEVRARWPHLLPWALAHSRFSRWAGVTALVVVVGVLIALLVVLTT